MLGRPLRDTCLLFMALAFLGFLLFQPAGPPMAAPKTKPENPATKPKTTRNLPVNIAQLEKDFQLRDRKKLPYSNLLTWNQLLLAVRDQPAGPELNFAHVKQLTDGTTINPAHLHGTLRVGPYPFLAHQRTYATKRFRFDEDITKGRCPIPLAPFFADGYNSEEWTDAGQICLRVELYLAQPGPDRSLGWYDFFLAFEKAGDGFIRRPTIVDGPSLHLVQSDDPTQVTISLETYPPVPAQIVLTSSTGEKIKAFSSAKNRQHEVNLTGLEPDQSYFYQLLLPRHAKVEIGKEKYYRATQPIQFRSAPDKRSTRSFRFACMGDSRTADGGGKEQLMGTNALMVENLMQQAHRLKAEFFVMNGDLVNGYTPSRDDFLTQMHGFHQATAGFARNRALYTVLGNHESIMFNYENNKKYGLNLDRWPYKTHSGEAAFALTNVNPTNGPQVADKRLPTYSESVYSFQFGMVRFIVFNTDYWISYDPLTYGGCPEGYILPDQMKWIKNQLVTAENDSSVRYTILMTHESLFPNGGHLKDGMWYQGDNRVRAGIMYDGKLELAEKGILQVRDELLRAIHGSKKVVAVLGSDEHSYHRTLIDNKVPIGNFPKDDKNKDGIIQWETTEPATPLPDLDKPVWYIVNGGGGAPYYSEQPNPWNTYWKKRDPRGRFYRFTPQQHLFVFDVSTNGIRFRAINYLGETIDRIEDLTKIPPRGPKRRADLEKELDK